MPHLRTAFPRGDDRSHGPCTGRLGRADQGHRRSPHGLAHRIGRSAWELPVTDA